MGKKLKGTPSKTKVEYQVENLTEASTNTEIDLQSTSESITKIQNLEKMTQNLQRIGRIMKCFQNLRKETQSISLVDLKIVFLARYELKHTLHMIH